MTKVKQIQAGFEKSMEKSGSHQQYRDQYLDITHQLSMKTAEIDMPMKTLVAKCQFKQGEEETHKIYILYHATTYFEVKKLAQEAKTAH